MLYSVDSLVETVDEIKCFLLGRRWNLILEAMVDPVDTKPLKDYAIPTKEEPYHSIVHPSIAAHNFELKPSSVGMVQQNQFANLPSENPNLHLSIFVDSYGTVKENGVD